MPIPYILFFSVAGFFSFGDAVVVAGFFRFGCLNGKRARANKPASKQAIEQQQQNQRAERICMLLAFFVVVVIFLLDFSSLLLHTHTHKVVEFSC